MDEGTTGGLRPAVPADADRISALMRESILRLFPAFYDERQTASGAEHIAKVDRRLIDDGTYYVAEVDGDLVACGGWSRRGKLYTGSGEHGGDDRLLDPSSEAAHVRAMFVRSDWTRRGLGRAILERCRDAARDAGFSRLDLMATLPGVPLYASFGFTEVERVMVTLPDGVRLAGVVMHRPIDLP